MVTKHNLPDHSTSVRVENLTGYIGIENVADKRDRPKPWRAVIRINGRRYRWGYFATPEEAAKEYDDVARRHPINGRPRKLNFR